MHLLNGQSMKSMQIIQKSKYEKHVKKYWYEQQYEAHLFDFGAIRRSWNLEVRKEALIHSNLVMRFSNVQRSQNLVDKVGMMLKNSVM
jgi:hypothetical protein